MCGPSLPQSIAGFQPHQGRGAYLLFRDNSKWKPAMNKNNHFTAAQAQGLSNEDFSRMAKVDALVQRFFSNFHFSITRFALREGLYGYFLTTEDDVDERKYTKAIFKDMEDLFKALSETYDLAEDEQLALEVEENSIAA